MALLENTDLVPRKADVPPLDRPATRDARRSRHSEYRRRLLALVSVDVGALLVVSSAAVVLGAEATFLVITIPATVLGLRIGDLYRRRTAPSALDESGGIATGAAVGALLGAAVSGAAARDAALVAAGATLALLLTRSLAYRVERLLVRRHPRRVLVVGSGAGGQAFAARILRRPGCGMVPVGFVDSSPDPIDPDLPVGVVATLPELVDAVDRLAVDRIVIDAASVAEEDVLAALDRATREGIEIVVLPALAEHLSTAVAVEELAGMTLLAYRRNARHSVSWAAKRVLDVTLAAVLVAASLPVWAAIAVAIKLDSRGPVFFRQRRVGRNGRPFTLLKFRSMTVDAEDRLIDLTDHNVADGPLFKVATDPRCTRVGRILRRYSLDELPQLLNVLAGEMSLVGPRPSLASEVAEYPEWFHRRLTVPPGLTGIWQVSGRFLLPFDEATRLDVFYADHWSFGLDLKILARTPWVVLTGRGGG